MYVLENALFHAWYSLTVVIHQFEEKEVVQCLAPALYQVLLGDHSSEQGQHCCLGQTHHYGLVPPHEIIPNDCYIFFSFLKLKFNS